MKNADDPDIVFLHFVDKDVGGRDDKLASTANSSPPAKKWEPGEKLRGLRKRYVQFKGGGSIFCLDEAVYLPSVGERFRCSA